MKIGNGKFVRRPFLDFPAKQDVVLKIKQICHIEYKTPEQMPFIFLDISSSSRVISESVKCQSVSASH